MAQSQKPKNPDNHAQAEHPLQVDSTDRSLYNLFSVPIAYGAVTFIVVVVIFKVHADGSF